MNGLRLDGDNAGTGLYLLLGLIAGALLYGFILYPGPLGSAEMFYASGYIIEDPAEFQSVLSTGDKPKAVMFSSETCPVCKAMEPYWRRLASNGDLPVEFWILMLNNSTVESFLEHNVTETPTFILFVNGTERARHVGAFTGGNITRVMLEWALNNVHADGSYTRSGDSTPLESSHVQAVGVATALLLGFLAALSPCVFPLLAAYASTLASQGASRARWAIAAFAASMMGAMTVGVLFLLLGEAVAGLGEVLTLAAGVAVTAAGVLGVLGVPVHMAAPAVGRRGIIGFSLVYGLLAVQCSLPLVLGALLIIASSGLGGVAPLLGFAAGVAAPVALAVALPGKLGLGRFYTAGLARYGYMVVAVSGLVLLAYTMGVISF